MARVGGPRRVGSIGSPGKREGSVGRPGKGFVGSMLTESLDKIPLSYPTTTTTEAVTTTTAAVTTTTAAVTTTTSS
jgi:hypothetical protein